MAAAVGSLMIRITSNPAMVPASLVAALWASLKSAMEKIENSILELKSTEIGLGTNVSISNYLQAGTVTTARVTLWPR